jgi:hypothetical protein
MASVRRRSSPYVLPGALRLQTFRDLHGKSAAISQHVRLNADGRGLKWVGNDGDKEMVLSEMPDSTPSLKTVSRLLAPFVPVEQL